MRTLLIFAFLAGCGGGQTHPAAPEEAPALAGATTTPTDAAAPTVAPSGPIACRIQGATCTEYRDAPPERGAELREQCAKAGGEALGACPTENLAATCTVPKPPMTVVSSLYRGPDKKKVHAMLGNARRSCEANGGTFTAAKR